MKNITFTELSHILDEELLQRIIPFWLLHAVDKEFGGLLTCLDENGKILSFDKYLWSQTRALWVFSTLARRTADPEHLALAKSLFHFCNQHGRNARNEWVFQVSRDGQLIQDADSIYADGFAMLGLAAYFTLTDSSRAAQLLRETCYSVQQRLAIPGSYGTAPYPLPTGMKTHGISMLFSLAFWEAGLALKDSKLKAEAVKLALDILEHFVSDQDQAILEFLDLHNRPVPGLMGTCCIPGHAIESMWSLIRIFRTQGQKEQVARCAEILRWHLEKGWDEEYGGIFLAIDLAGQPPYWPFAEYKPWWPAVESMYALLLAYAETRQPWCLSWYEKVHNYAFTHYPVKPQGEWYNRLDRTGKPIETVIALPVKDPFHLPRTLMSAVEVLSSLADEPQTLNLVID